MTLHTQLYHSPCGDLILGEIDGHVCLCDWHRPERTQPMQRILNATQCSVDWQSTAMLCQVALSLDKYFAGELQTFNHPTLLFGSEFQKQVWHALTDIDYGTTATYRQIAQKLEEPSAVRAIANAIGQNPLSIIVPCHRIIGSDGQLHGYAGGTAAKKHLLTLESLYTSTGTRLIQQP